MIVITLALWHKTVKYMFYFTEWTRWNKNISFTWKGLSWSWFYGSWIYNYLCNLCLSPLKLWVRTLLRRSVLDTTLCDTVCQWLAEGRWYSRWTPVLSTNKTDSHDITEILLKVALSTINQTKALTWISQYFKDI